MYETFSGSAIDNNEIHSGKTDFPIDVTLFGRVIDDNDLKNEKADLSTVATLFGSVIDDNKLQPQKVKSLIVLTLSGIEYDVSLLKRIPSFDLKCALPLLTVIDSNLLHQLNASLPINETPSRIVIDFNELHFEKAVVKKFIWDMCNSNR